jgi:ADP-heptose:LPS heptosyltransferase
MDDHPPPVEKKKFLIIRLSSIGDIVLTSPIVRAIFKQSPNAEIHFLVKKEYKIVIESNPYIFKIHEFEKTNKNLVHELKQENFDYVIDLQKNQKSISIIRKIGVPFYSFNKLNFRKWLFVNLKINTLPIKHIVDRYFESISQLGIQNDHDGLDFFIPEDTYFDYDDLPAVFEDGFVTIALGSMHGTKRIPTEKIIEISCILHYPVVLLGGKDVIQEGEDIASAIPDRVYNACGKLNLYQSASLISKSTCLLTSDTGLMHIGAALKSPVAVMWGNTVPEFGMYPYMPKHTDLFRNFETTTLNCRPCSKLGFKKCPRGHFNCMKSLDTQEIADWINLF